MKYIFAAVFFFNLMVMAQAQPENANIVCLNKSSKLQVNIDTAAGKAWMKDISHKNSLAVEVEGPLFSGVYSSEKFQGEILGEIVFKKVPMYVTIILSKIDESARLELQMYPKDRSTEVDKVLMETCVIK